MNSFDADARTLYDRDIDPGRRSSLSILLDLIPPGTEVLDVGIGGGALGRHLAVERGCRVDGATISAHEAANAAAYYRRLEVADLNEVELDTLFAGQRYGRIVCADVIEHLPRPTAILDACRRLLADDGRLLLSVPNVGYSGLIAELLEGEFRYRHEGLLDRSHVRFFTRRSLLRLLGEQGWQVDSLTPVFLDLPDSEFRAAVDLLPPAVRRHLLTLPDGLTYQFIVAARPVSGVDAAADITVSEPQRHQVASYSLQLYLKDASGYSEDRKLTALARIGERRQTVRFSLPQDSRGFTGLRLDPADRPGFLQLFAMRLLDGRGDASWTWDGKPESLQTGALHEVSFRTPWTMADGAVLLLTGDDPYFELPVGPTHLAACGSGAALEVELAWPMSAEYLLFADELSRRSALEAALARELAEARADAQQAAERLSQALQELSAARHDIELARAENAAAAGAAASLAAEIDALKRRLDTLVAAREEVVAEHRRSAQEIASLTYALDHQRSATEANAEQCNLLRERLETIEASRWFRLGASVAGLLGRAGSPLVIRTSTQLPARPVGALRPPRAGVCVVVPVYRGLAETRTCLESVLRSSSKAALHVVVVNDASPDPEIASLVGQLADRDARIVLIENAENLGFVASANRGMQERPDDDVILLNSDTEVAGDWIDRLRAAAYRERSIATVTPFSNAATICSYPHFCVEGPMPADMSTAALDRYFAAENGGQLVDIPTAVGFCMFIRRDCLEEVGLFDVERFGRGYGEENDFCMRARATGWRHVLALDTFVRHASGVSFGEEKAARVKEAQDVLARLHPDYRALVAAHLQRNPARVARLKVDLARIRASGLPSVLFVSHVGGGGTERHLHELARELDAQANVFLLRPTGDGGETALDWLRAGEGFQLGFRLPDQLDELVDGLRALGVSHVHYHHTRGHPALVLTLPARLGVTHDFTAHDFYSICPQVTLTDEIGRYCGEFGPEQCHACLLRRPAPDGLSIEAWRADFGRLLEGARNVYAPSEDAATRLRRYFPAIQARRVPHPDVVAPVAAPAPEPIDGTRPLRIVVIGALSQIKGADLLEAAAVLAAQRGSRLDFHLVGFGYKPLRTAPGARLTVHGQYAEQDLPGLLAEISPDVAWFPALWPETYSYTLSAALKARLPVVAVDLGAFPERLSGRAWTWVRPWYWLSEEWVQFFEALLSRHFDTGIAPAPAPVRASDPPDFLYSRDYLRDLRPVRPAAGLSMDFLAKHRLGQNSESGIA